jgi:3D (Asp-Asp-Asp) domain-containing protein
MEAAPKKGRTSVFSANPHPPPHLMPITIHSILGRAVLACLFILMLFGAFGCSGEPKEHSPEHSLKVVATAYTSRVQETQGDPRQAAWGDRLKPGMKAVAVSRDLIPMGLGHEARLSIDGLEGEYRVLDKMAARWRKRIDIYFGNDLEGAREWGKREVVIRWKPKKEK